LGILTAAYELVFYADMSTNTLRSTRGALLMAALTGALSHLTFAQYVAPTTTPHEHSEEAEEPKAGHLVNELFVGEKIYIQKYKARKQYRRRTGFRASIFKVKITTILA